MGPIRASSGKFAVLGVDTFDHTECWLGEFDSLEKAKDVAAAKGGTMFVTHVYNDRGEHQFSAGTF